MQESSRRVFGNVSVKFVGDRSRNVSSDFTGRASRLYIARLGVRRASSIGNYGQAKFSKCGRHSRHSDVYCCVNECERVRPGPWHGRSASAVGANWFGSRLAGWSEVCNCDQDCNGATKAAGVEAEA